MPDLYFEDYDHEARENRPGDCFRSIGILCVIIVGFSLFFTIYWFIFEYMLAPLSSHGLELATLGLVFAILFIVYFVRSRSLEKAKRLAAS